MSLDYLYSHLFVQDLKNTQQPSVYFPAKMGFLSITLHVVHIAAQHGFQNVMGVIMNPLSGTIMIFPLLLYLRYLRSISRSGTG